MRVRQLVVPFAATMLGLAGCGKSGPDVFAEAEALEGQGKLEEAAEKFELTCVFAPKGEKCIAADGRATEARIKAADKAISEGQFVAAERLLTMALATTDEATAKKVTDHLAADDLTQGLAYQRALGRSDKQEIQKALEGIAASKAPVAQKAKEWLDKERPALVIAAVKAACGPDHKGSCSRAAADLKAAGIKTPDADEGTALAENEERRVFPLRTQAESFLALFASRGQRDKTIEKCIGGAEPDEPAEHAKARCTEENTPEDDYDQQKNNASLWRRLLKSIADPALTEPLEERRRLALLEGQIDKLAIPKPKPAPKK